MEFDQKVIMFGGKGGVGKSTISAATAMHYASAGENTLVLSSDPAPSLSDLFEKKIGDRETRITKNLYALELSSDEVLKRWKKKFGPEIYEVISSIADVEYDIVDYVGGAPGIDEEFMLDYIISLVNENRYDRVIWDTAPTGHTIRLLNLPSQFVKHLNAATKVYMKFNKYMNPAKNKRSIFDIIKSWSGLAEDVISFIRDPKKTTFVAVTIPEALGVYQTERLIEEFRKYDLRVSDIVINNVIEKPDCEFHTIRRNMQQKYIKEIERRYEKEIRIMKIPLLEYEVKGFERLKSMERILFGCEE